MILCKSKQQKLCGKDTCETCFNRSLVSYKGKTPSGKLKVDCWDYVKNGDLTPRNVTSKSHKIIWFECDKCRHSFKTLPQTVSRGRWCPYCCKPCKKLCEDDDCTFCHNNSLASYTGKTPSGKPKVDCWDSEKNGDLTPRNVMKYSKKNRWFNCPECPHRWSVGISSVSGGCWCPYCSNQKLCENESCEFCRNNSFASYTGKTPLGKLKAHCWDSEKNGDLKPRDVFKSSGKSYWHRCDKCPHSFKQSLDQVKRGFWCPYCCKPCKKLCADDDCTFCHNNSFASYTGKTTSGKPKVDCWDSEKNGDLTPRNVMKYSHKKHGFKCDKCCHSFKSSPDKVSGGKWCPFCCKPCTKLCEDDDCTFCHNNSLASYTGKTPSGKPKVDCWDSEKNGNLTPLNVMKYSNKKRWFNCPECQHTIQKNPASVVGGEWCPYCCKACKKLCEDGDCTFCHNKSFASYTGKTPLGKPKVDCWNKKNDELKPRKLTKSSGKVGHFTCDDCMYEFKKKIEGVTQGAWCPVCVRKTEKKLYTWLKTTYPDLTIIKEYQPDWCKNIATGYYLPFDFYINEFNLIIELDGRQHFEVIEYWKNDPEQQQVRDRYKMQCANSKNISVIRIKQVDVYYDKINWTDELTKKIKSYERCQNIYVGDYGIHVQASAF